MPVDAYRTLSASGASTPIPLNQYCPPFNVGFGVWFTGTGDMVARVEHCFDLQVSANTFWFTHIDVSAFGGSGASTPVDGNYAYPVTHVRHVVTDVSGTGTCHFHLLQTGV
tara:strand:- start:1390 stop:1722 length:333 start_codon:yes stop_codon:yes gene_type:complete